VCLSETQFGWQVRSNRVMLCLMRDVCSLIWLALVGLFQSRVSLEAEILVLRHQLNVLRRKSPKKLSFTRSAFSWFESYQAASASL
jgi:hypothetical protein